MEFLTSIAPYLALACSLVGVGFAVYLVRWILSQDTGTDRMRFIAGAIQKGARTFLMREYRYVAILVVGVIVTMVVLSTIPGARFPFWTAPAFALGALCSLLAGYFGMGIAVRSNVRTAAAAAKSLNSGLRVAFASGTVMGTLVVSLALLGLSVLFILFTNVIYPDDLRTAAAALAGFGFGGTSIAIFARVGGGIFTKAADVGADLVGKTEAGIPEDDPRNPAVIADNVGDNVGDVAGMGSDLFESYAGSIIAAITIAALAKAVSADAAAAEQGVRAFIGITGEQAIVGEMFPLLVAAIGLLIGMGSSFLVRTSENATQATLLGSLRRGVYAASLIVAAAIFLLGMALGLGFGVVLATWSGLLAGVLIGTITEYFTSDIYRPTKGIAESAVGGPAIVIIRGLAVGMQSTVAPVVVIIIATLVAVGSAGLYGVAMAAVGMLATLSITLATDAYGPVADNAGGIAEMSGMDAHVRERTDALDSLGNTTAATGKGFAIGSAAMTALALISAFVTATGMNPEVNVLDPRLPTGLLLGAVLPFLFSAQSMLAVGRAAQQIVLEVRRQFNEIPGLREGKAEPDYARCVAISTDSAVREMIAPGLIAVVVPVALTVLTILARGTQFEKYIGVQTLVGVLLGSLISAFMLGVMMSNAGGAWDNAKKYIERGHMGGKRSDPHKATVVGDTVGDPFKDTAGPSLNILLKLLAIVSLVLAPLLVGLVN